MACTKDSRLPSLRILHYMPTNFGMTGVETFILQLCVAQKRLGIRSTIAIDLRSREEVGRIANENGIAVFDLAEGETLARGRQGKLTKLLTRLRRVRAIGKLQRLHDVMHIHAVGIAGLEGFLASWSSPLIVTHHATLSWYSKYWNVVSSITFWLERRYADRVVFPYSTAAEEMIGRGISRSQMTVIPFCVDEAAFEGVARKPLPGQLTLIMSARMFGGKGHMELLGAMGQLHSQYPMLRAILIGDGPTRPEIEAEILRLDLSEVVECRGRVDHRHVPAVMRSGHVVVLPSYMEGEMFPLCLLEGMALGLPAIGTRIAGIPDIIADGETGILVEPRDLTGLARAIEKFIVDTDFLERARMSAQVRFRSRYGAGAVARAYAEAYKLAQMGSKRI
nr:glycosyltransferase family 4 protein [Bradyrhizobium symbiodeficiens]